MNPQKTIGQAITKQFEGFGNNERAAVCKINATVITCAFYFDDSVGGYQTSFGIAFNKYKLFHSSKVE